MLTQGNRFYMEGSIEFLDEQGEWHYDRNTSMLYVFPPPGISLAAETTEIVLTQTDTLFEFVGSSSEHARVENITFADMTFGHTSAQFFRPHEETSGGDYATHRSGAIRIENATARQAPFAYRSLTRALLMPQVNPGSLYRRGRST